MRAPAQRVKRSPMNVIVAPGSPAARKYAAPDDESIAAGVAPTPSHDLLFLGGKTIANLRFITLFVCGDAWDPTEIESINSALAGAMSDDALNDIIGQYFTTEITTEFLGSYTLSGSAPATVAKTDIESMLLELDGDAAFGAFDPITTVFAFALPSGTVLTDSATSGNATRRTHARRIMPEAEAVDSLNGLAGFHGSVDRASGETLYYAVGVYSATDGDTTNGIVAFDTPWKNVVATLYHELNEARTDPDVERVLAGGPESFLGWISSQGEECGDFPLEEADPLSLVFQEVPLAGGGSAPVQFLYSNRVHGPESPVTAASPVPDKSPAAEKRRVGEVLRDAIEAALGQRSAESHDQTHSSDSYGVTVHYKTSA
jgi:hypothetical protein